MKSFHGKTALITGGSSGIGLALGVALARRGAAVAVTGTDETKLAAARTTLEATGARALALKFDVTDESAWRQAAREVETKLGGIHFLALNAGLGGGSGGTLETVPSSLWQLSWDINVMGAVHGLQSCLPGMLASGEQGHIIFTSSVAGAMRNGMVGPYGVTKAALIALAENLRAQLSPTRLGVSVMIPGPIRTAFTDTSARHSGVEAPAHFKAMLKEMLAQVGLEPEQMAEFTLERIAQQAFYIFSHSGLRTEIAARGAECAAASDIGLAALPVFNPAPQK